MVADSRLVRLGLVGARCNVTSNIFKRSPNGLSEGSIRGISQENFILPVLEGPFFSKPQRVTLLHHSTHTISIVVIITTLSILACCDISLCPYFCLLSETGAPLQTNDRLAVESRMVIKTAVVVCLKSFFVASGGRRCMDAKEDRNCTGGDLHIVKKCLSAKLIDVFLRRSPLILS